jgi:transposase
MGRASVHVEVARARELLAQGVLVRAVAKKLGVGASTVTSALRGDAPETRSSDVVANAFIPAENDTVAIVV